MVASLSDECQVATSFTSCFGFYLFFMDLLYLVVCWAFTLVGKYFFTWWQNNLDERCSKIFRWGLWLKMRCSKWSDLGNGKVSTRFAIVLYRLYLFFWYEDIFHICPMKLLKGVKIRCLFLFRGNYEKIGFVDCSQAMEEDDDKGHICRRKLYEKASKVQAFHPSYRFAIQQSPCDAPGT